MITGTILAQNKKKDLFIEREIKDACNEKEHLVEEGGQDTFEVMFLIKKLDKKSDQEWKELE